VKSPVGGSLDSQAFRNAMARVSAAVSIITTDGPAGRTGVTASAVCSVTDDPPTLLVCINRASRHNAIFKANGRLCVNTLSANQDHLSGIFAGLTKDSMDARFAAGAWSELALGSPVLVGATASFDCEINQVREVGTHTVFFCRVHEVQTHMEGSALVYFDRRYYNVRAAAAQPAGG
jgi:flavin reductase